MNNWRRFLGTSAAALPVALLISCGGDADPLASGEGPSTRVAFDFAGLEASGTHDVCAEIDAARLTTSPAGRNARMQSAAPEDCQASFRVTVPPGRVEFEGLLAGGNRPLFRGSAIQRIEEDGFRVVIDLDEIDALEVRTKTLGVYGPTEYRYHYRGASDFEPIGKDDTVTIAALAGGARQVTLDPRPCTVVNGPAELDVPIPPEATRLGDHEFEIDCGIGGGLTIEVVTRGSGSPPDYPLDITSESGSITTRIGVNETRTFGGVGPGPFDALLTVPSPCSVLDDAPPEPFMTVAGSFVIIFTVTCTQIGPPSGTLAIRTQAPAPPPPGSTPTFAYEVRDVGGTLVRSGTIGVGATVSESGLPTSGNDYSVTLTPTGTCTPQQPTTKSATVPANGTVTVFYEVRC